MIFHGRWVPVATGADWVVLSLAQVAAQVYKKV